jgi:hypothetical protein
MTLSKRNSARASISLAILNNSRFAAYAQRSPDTEQRIVPR